MGLSVSTVSRALNDNQRISLQTRRQVKEVAEALGYQPNYNARNLTNQEANSVGVIFPVNNRVVDNIFFTLACYGELTNSLTPGIMCWPLRSVNLVIKFWKMSVQ